MMGLKSRARTLLVGCVVATTVFLTVLAGSGQATFPGSDGAIVFQNPRGGAFYTVNPDGSGQNRIPRTGPLNGINADPAFSATERIVFSHTNSDGSRSSIAYMHPDGSGRQTVMRTHGLHFFDPTFSPNGRRITFVFKDDIWVVRTTGTRMHRLGGTRRHDVDPSYSPNSRMIVWGAGNHIYVMNANGADKHMIARGRHYAEPSFSPDGTRILFTGGPTKFDTTVRNILEMNLDGSALHHVTDDAGTSFVYHDPHFSPSGTRIVATGTNPNPECNNCDQLQIMNAQGGNRHPLTNTASVHADWGPAAG